MPALGDVERAWSLLAIVHLRGPVLGLELRSWRISSVEKFHYALYTLTDNLYQRIHAVMCNLQANKKVRGHFFAIVTPVNHKLYHYQHQ